MLFLVFIAMLRNAITVRNFRLFVIIPYTLCRQEPVNLAVYFVVYILN